VALAGAAEGALAFEGERMGYFTAAILETIDQLRGQDVSYAALMDTVARELRIQRPTIGVFGDASPSVAAAAAFVPSAASPKPHYLGRDDFGHSSFL
jgi:hypothetical protein